MSAGLSLGKIKNMFYIGNTQFSVVNQQVDNSDPRLLRKCLENPHAIVQTDVLKAHLIIFNFIFEMKLNKSAGNSLLSHR